MLAQRHIETAAEVTFKVQILEIKPSHRSPDEYFRVLWSIAEGDKLVETSFTVKFTDPVIISHNLRPYRDVSNNKITQAEDMANILLNHLVVDESGHGINHSIEFFFAEKPDGGGRFDGYITWDYKGAFFAS